jgi:NAD-reducing hydrogenase large subunit
VPGGVANPLDVATRDAILKELPEAAAIAWRTLDLFKCILDGFPSEIETFGKMPTMYAGMVSNTGDLRLYDGRIRFKSANGAIAAEIDAAQYADYIGEASLSDSYLKAPYYKPLGYPDGIYRVGPLARLNVADRCGTPNADTELREFRERFGPIVDSSFHYHYARLIEVVHCLERLQIVLETPAVLDRHVRARAEVNALEGIGVAEAPRGILIHHYKVNELGAMQWANLIIATGHNNLAMNRSIEQVSRYYVKGDRLQEGMLNRVSAVVRAYDPCLSCSTHAGGVVPLRIELVGPGGEKLDEVSSESR